MFVAYRDHGGLRVPFEQTESALLDGRLVVLRTAPPYLLDGEIEPGWTLSPIRTELRYTHFLEDGHDYESNRRVRPVVCQACHDNGEDGDSDYGCRACHGYGKHVNAHRCSECGEFSAEPLPVHPRETLNHELLLRHAHVACAVEALRTVVVGEAA